MNNIIKFNSQWKQDEIVANYLNNKKNGYFVDVGAGLPEQISNTLVFERYFDWSGILIEPNTDSFNELVKNRKSKCVQALVADRNFLANYCHCDDIWGFGNHIEGYAHWKIGPKGIEYIQTKTLTEILDENNAPLNIDYLSIDVEGVEHLVLQGINFSKYNFSIITIEINGKLNILNNILSPNQYKLMKIIEGDAVFIKI